MDPTGVPPEIWEAICRRCGRCCMEKVEIRGRIHMTAVPCRFLDEETRRCGAYPDRYRAEPGCVSTMEGLPRMIYPADCPYTRGIPGYEAPLDPNASG